MKMFKLIKKQPERFFTTASTSGVNLWALILLTDMIEKEVKQLEKMERKKQEEDQKRERQNPRVLNRLRGS